MLLLPPLCESPCSSHAFSLFGALRWIAHVPSNMLLLCASDDHREVNPIRAHCSQEEGIRVLKKLDPSLHEGKELLTEE